MPVHNKAQYLGRALESVLGQSFSDFELITIDDASTDNSLEIIRGVNDPRVRKHRRLTPGPGGYAARNMGIRLARGSWVTFLDADDEWLEDHLNHVHSYIAGHPECHCVGTGFYLTRGRDLKMDSYSRTEPARPAVFDLSSYLQARLRGLELISTNTIILKRKLLGDGLIFPQDRAVRGGDEETWLRLFMEGMRMVRLPEVTAVYHLDAGNMVTGKSSNVLGPHPVLMRTREFMKELDDPDLKRLLACFANRKTLAWARVARESGRGASKQLKRLTWQGMDMYCLLSALAMLVLPGIIFKKLAELVRDKK